jgi:hypothetical protein
MMKEKRGKEKWIEPLRRKVVAKGAKNMKQ